MLPFVALKLGPTDVLCSSDVVHADQGLQPGIGNFQAGEDRYFFNGEIKIEGRSVTIPLKTDLFKLERRKTMRVVVVPAARISLNITEVDHKPVFVNAVLFDVSAGGLKMTYEPSADVPALTKQSEIVGVLHLPSTRTISFRAGVRHIQQVSPHEVHYGIEFINPEPVYVQRMLGLTMELQRIAVLSGTG